MAINKISESFINGAGTWSPVKKALLKINEVIDSVNSITDGVGTDTFENITVTSTTSLDTISERTAAAGVTIDGLLLKDGRVQPVLGNVTQITSAATAVTTIGSCGIVTTVSLTAASDTSVGFTINNTILTTASLVSLSIAEYQGQGTPIVLVQVLFNGSVNIKIVNVHPSQALNNVVKLGYQIIS